MPALPIVILPGLDGSALLVRDFVALSNAHVIEYPDRVMSYDELAADAIARMPERPVLIGESFGGAVAAFVASRVDVAALVLVNSFIVAPVPRVFARAPVFVPPQFALRWFMVGGSRERARLMREVIRAMNRDVLASRIRMALSVDLRAQLAATKAPLLDLRSRGDRLVSRRNRAAVIAARPDGKTAELDGPHALLFSRAATAWEEIRRAVC